jgi:hypothetical protein
MLVGELCVVFVPHDVECAALHLVVEPGAAEDQLAQPVDERLALDERHALPVPDQVPAEPRRGRVDQALRRQRDEVLDLLLVELRRLDDAELHRRADDPPLEISGAEREVVAEDLDDVVAPG